MNALLKPSRRSFIKGGIAGGFLLAFHMPVYGADEPNQPPDDTTGKFAPNAYIRIDKTGKTTLLMPQVEMGQGVYTSVAMILAEELDADYSLVALEHAPPDDKAYGNPVFGIQVTGNSNSIRAFWKPLRTAGATARAMLVQAAAKQWKVDASSCTASAGKVTHTASNRTLTYGELADAATKETPPKDPPLKDPKNFTLIGKPLKRFDTPGKVDGSAVYGIDAMLPGMKFATIAASPVFGGKVAHVDDSAAKQIAGVYKVIALDDMVTYLVGVIGNDDAKGRTFEVGGPEVLRYADMLERTARIVHRPLIVVPVPVLSPGLSARWLRLITDVDLQTARSLVDSMTNEVIARESAIRTVVPQSLMTFAESVEKALADRAASGR